MVLILFRVLSNGISIIRGYFFSSSSGEYPSSSAYKSIAPSVGSPITFPSDKRALLHKAQILRAFSGEVSQVSLTDIRFKVRVPVLSVHITVQDPKVSTARSFLTTALVFAILCIPKARVSVRIAGNPSGTAATARDTAVVNVSTRGLPLKNSIINTAALTKRAIRPKLFPRLAIFSWRGVLPSSSCIISAILPMEVFIPISITTPFPRPETTYESI